ncbi:hypothetical protein SD960_20115 [Flavobacterium sp. MMLR14_040]|uniref:hypothetical protein n=1 Tax=Flavobacterium sp. MMLR14_040 TaxID=3093843 RepID=UPI00299072BF|nr:hypothetical protein [Flavobacterium sp. MMLR14_040]MDW8852418.1 hypothetical protein [Flavobacterium sp. MMLR14_040]
MQQQDFLYSNSDKNFLLKKTLSGILFLLLFGIFYMYSFIILMSIESIDRNFLAEYFYIMRVGIATSLSCIFMFLFYDKKNPLLSISKLLLLLFIASFFSVVFAYMFKNSPFWVLKYSIGIITGLFFYFIYKKEKGNSLSGVVSLLALLLCENLERFFIMDPPGYPSVLYIKSFPDIFLWFGTVVFVFFSSYFFAGGFLIKNKFLDTSSKILIK